MVNLVFLVLAVIIFFYTGIVTGQILSCYYEIVSYNISIIDPTLCTHIILIGSTDLDAVGHFQQPPQSVTEEFAKLKNRGPVRLLVSITGNPEHFTTLVSSEDTMQQFANESLAYLQESGIDGIDIDWEFPVWSRGAKKTDKSRFGDLLRIVREKYGTEKLITAAVAGPPTIARIAYEMDYFNKYVDFVQLMNYDFHVFNQFLPFVGFNAPLRKLPYEKSVLAAMNSESALFTYLSMGLWKNKTVFGIPTYGRAYTLFNAFINEPYSLATADEGAVGYSDVCNKILANSANSIHYTVEWDNPASSPYLHGHRTWITYENVRSVTEKTNYAIEQRLAGVMVFDIKGDDALGLCGNGSFPLIRTIRNTLFG